MAALLLCTPTAAAAACCDSQLIHDAAVSFARNGFAVLPNFASQVEVNAMRSAMEGLVEAWWNEERAAPDHDRNVFTTGANQTSAQAKSNYFFTSADRVHFFREAVDEGDASSTQPRPHLNKVGHGLHLNGRGRCAPGLRLRSHLIQGGIGFFLCTQAMDCRPTL